MEVVDLVYENEKQLCLMAINQRRGEESIDDELQPASLSIMLENHSQK